LERVDVSGLAGGQSMSGVLYLTRTSLLEPLGQGQVLAYLSELAPKWPISLVTIEPHDLAHRPEAAKLSELCASAGINWLPQPILLHGRRRSMAELRALWCAARVVAKRGEVRLVHARSHLPALVALQLRRRFGCPFIFDMRALWLEERISSGSLVRGSILHRLLARGEAVCLKEASAVVSLTQAAVLHLKAVYPGALDGQRVEIIPTCADLELFVPRAAGPERPRIYGCLGTVLSPWFRTDWLGDFFHEIARRDSEARFEIVSRDAPERVREALGLSPDMQNRLSVRSASRSEVPDVIARHSASFVLYSNGLDRLGCCPTRLGELLACGVPVVASSGTGDVDALLEGRGVGVTVNEAGEKTVGEALDALGRLLTEPALSERCRRVAEAEFALARGVAAYGALYEQVGDIEPDAHLRLRHGARDARFPA
jgi:glycosyltransferase involved in cell wall biosynthesis